jgi:predicted PurR-regulated permease PerM
MTEMAEPKNSEPPSPSWQPTTRLAVGVLLLILAAILLRNLSDLLVPVTLALLLAYLLHPPVSRLAERLHISRGLSIVIVYIVLGLLMAAVTAALGLAVSQQVAGLVEDLREISREIPSLLQQLETLRFTIGPWTIDLQTVNLDPILTSLTSALQPLLTQTGAMVASVAGATAGAVGVLLVILVLGYYMLIDFGTLDDSLIGMIPPAHQDDIRRLLDETGLVWSAFFRGQLLLALVIGGAVALVLTILGLRFSLVLGLIAGVLEFVPIFGPAIAGLIAVLVALFQGGNWWGLGPWAFAAVVLAVFVIIQQVENNILVPRIIGHSLNLHPLLVLMAALAGGTLAGVLGLLLAAPTVASLRLWVGYIYRKVVGLETWPGHVVRPRPPGKRRLPRLRRFRRKQPDDSMGPGADRGAG